MEHLVFQCQLPFVTWVHLYFFHINLIFTKQIGSALLSYITKQYNERYAVLLSVIIFTVESFLIIFCIPDLSTDGGVSPRPSYRSRENSFRLVHHMNIGYLSTIKAKFDVLDDDFHENNNMQETIQSLFSLDNMNLLMYLGYLLFVDSINKGFGSIKVFNP